MRFVMAQGVLGETYPSTAGPYPLLVKGPDGNLVPVTRKYPIQPDEAYERKGFPSPEILEGLPKKALGRALLSGGNNRLMQQRNLATTVIGGFSRV